MTLVVDASVAIKWLMAEEGSDRALALVGTEPLVAPDLIHAEVANALWRHVIAGRATADEAAGALAALRDTLDVSYPLERFTLRAMELAVSLAHPVYDCLYVALTESLGTRLVTADARLIAKLSSAKMGHLVHAF